MDFIKQYFIDPITYGTGWNIVNTATYAIILIIAIVLIKKILNKLHVKLNNKLWYDLLPFVILGGLLRALEDTGTLPKHWLFITPMIYILVFCIAFSAILIEKYTKKKIVRRSGSILLILVSMTIIANGKNWLGFIGILTVAAACFAATYFVVKFVHYKLQTENCKLRTTNFKLQTVNLQVLFGHILDSSATFFSVSYLCVGGIRYTEAHVLPNLMFGILPVFLFIPLKILVILFALRVIDKETNGDWNWMFKFTIFVVGLGPGVRNITTALMNSSFC